MYNKTVSQACLDTIPRNVQTLTNDSNRKRLYQLQLQDDDLMQVRSWIEQKRKPEKKEFQLLPAELKAYANVFEQLFLDPDEVICRVPHDPNQFKGPRVCLPPSCIDEEIYRIHQELGHMKDNATIHRVNQFYYFPNVTTHCQRIIRNCETCQQKNRAHPAQKHTYFPSMVGQPWEKISIDIVGPLKTDSKGFKYIFTVKDCFTRYLEAFPCKNITADTIVTLLYNNIFLKYGAPLQCHSDQGLQLTSQLMETICQQLGIKKTVTPAYNPKSNPVERAHRDLSNVLRGILIEQNIEWTEALPTAVAALNASKSSVTGVTPNLAMFGRERRMPPDMIYGAPPSEELTMPKHLTQMTENTRQIHKHMIKNQNIAIARAEGQYSETEKQPFLEDDLVWLFTPIYQARKGRKFSSYWTGPWRIIKRISNLLFEIRNEGKWNSKQVQVIVSYDRIKRYHQNERTTVDPPLDLDAADFLQEAENVEEEDEFVHSDGMELDENDKEAYTHHDHTVNAWQEDPLLAQQLALQLQLQRNKDLQSSDNVTESAHPPLLAPESAPLPESLGKSASHFSHSNRSVQKPKKPKPAYYSRPPVTRSQTRQDDFPESEGRLRQSLRTRGIDPPFTGL